jgi:hypothetical protein
VSKTLDTRREPCRNARHPRITSGAQIAERACLQSVAGFLAWARFWQGRCTHCRRGKRPDPLRRVYVRQGEVISASMPTPVQPLLAVPVQRFRLHSATIPNSSPPARVENDPLHCLRRLPLASSDLWQEIDPPDVAASQSGPLEKRIFGARKQWKGKKQ